MVGLHRCNILSVIQVENLLFGQVFNSKYNLQEAVKIYSIKGHQEFVFVASAKKLLVLKCKKAEECQCLWKLRATVVKIVAYLLSTNIKAAYLCQSLLEPGPSSIGLKLGCCSYKGNN